MDAKLKEIAVLLQNDQREAAQRALMAYIQRDPRSAEAWYLLSWAGDTPEKRRRAVSRALALAPDEPRYQRRMKKLGAASVSRAGSSASEARKMPSTPASQARRSAAKSSAAPRRSSGMRLSLFLLLLVALLLGGGALLLASSVLNDGNRVAALPTRALLPSLELDAESSPTPELLLSETPAEIPAIVATMPSATAEPPTAMATAASTRTPTPFENLPVSPTAEMSVEATPTAELLVVGASAPETSSTASVLVLSTQSVAQPSPSPAESSAGSTPELATPAVLTSTATQLPKPSATPAPGGFSPPSNTVPLNSPGQVLGGEFRVLEFTMPAGALLNELGANAPAPPAGQRWALLEVSLICAAGKECLPQATALTLIGASGVRYFPDLSVRVDPVFGPEANAGGQVWGYVAYPVALNERNLWLQVQSGTGVLTFALR